MKLTIKDNTILNEITIIARNEDTGKEIVIEFSYNVQDKYTLLQVFLKTIEIVEHHHES